MSVSGPAATPGSRNDLSRSASSSTFLPALLDGHTLRKRRVPVLTSTMMCGCVSVTVSCCVRTPFKGSAGLRQRRDGATKVHPLSAGQATSSGQHDVDFRYDQILMLPA